MSSNNKKQNKNKKSNSESNIKLDKKSNNLLDETSPYLLQHAYNPVNWFPWGEKAFNLAKKENKPIFLSIGYSTCHWCHVMEKESFEDEEVAKILNDNFISIKVDREEMPAVDSMYMDSAMIFTGSGGWPLTVITDSDKKPFFAGTYYPKVSLIRILNNISNTWENDPSKLKNIASEVLNNLNNLNKLNKNQNINSDLFNYSTIEKGFETLKERFDGQYGGFGYSPKFPSVQNILFLNRYYIDTEDINAKLMVEKTLDGMFNGGIFDHIGGGFSRYSVDGQWLVPHFEKMMYDNGMLAIAYLEAGILFDKKYLKIAKKILDYCFREMLGENGFYTAQDADSEGEEGKYYLFTINDVRKVLGNSDAEKFCKIFDITREDEKNLSFVNGLMIATLALGGKALHNDDYIVKAEEVGEFILSKLTHNGILYTSYKDGKLRNKGVLDDYAYVIWGLLELYKVTLNTKWLTASEEMTNKMIDLFFEDGNLYLSASGIDTLPIRTKNIYDGAIPSGNNIAILNLMNLYSITNNNDYKDIFESILSNLNQDIEKNPLAFVTVLSGLIYNKTGGIHINFYIDSIDSTYSKDPALKIAKDKLDFWSPFLTVSIFDRKNEEFNENKVSICENMVCKPPIPIDSFSFEDITSKIIKY
ncbi:spermatogenesis-associated protein 20 [Holotrichia oblita]|nr:spermatogenesis-associated protein 20 [Holotrichia oblita]